MSHAVHYMFESLCKFLLLNIIRKQIIKPFNFVDVLWKHLIIINFLISHNILIFIDNIKNQLTVYCTILFINKLAFKLIEIIHYWKVCIFHSCMAHLFPKSIVNKTCTKINPWIYDLNFIVLIYKLNMFYHTWGVHVFYATAFPSRIQNKIPQHSFQKP